MPIDPTTDRICHREHGTSNANRINQDDTTMSSAVLLRPVKIALLCLQLLTLSVSLSIIFLIFYLVFSYFMYLFWGFEI